MTAAADRDVIRAWMDTRSDVQEYTGTNSCVRMLIRRGQRTELCGAPAGWFQGLLGGRARPEDVLHTVPRGTDPRMEQKQSEGGGSR